MKTEMSTKPETAGEGLMKRLYEIGALIHADEEHTHGSIVEHAAATLAADGAELEYALRSRDFYRNRCDLLQQWQSKMRDPERTIVCDILANCQTLPDPDGTRYGLAADGKAGGEVAREDSQEAAEAIQVMLKEYGYPSNSTNAARAGWRACRLSTRPQQAAQVAQPLTDDARDAARYRYLRAKKHYAILIGDEGFGFSFAQVEHWSNEQNEAKVDAYTDAAMAGHGIGKDQAS